MTSAQYNGLLAAIATSGSGGVTGAIILFGGAATPAGYLPCDGAAVSRATYVALFGAIGTAWGVGDGSTTFNVPDLRGRAPIGVGTGSGLAARVLGNFYGAEENAILQANLPSYALTVTDPGHTHDVTVSQDVATPAQAAVQGADTIMSPGTVPAAAQSATTGISVHSGGSGTPLPTLTPSAAVNYFIKT